MKKIVLYLVAVICICACVSTPKAYAAPEYKNPEDIIIASPKDNYSTTASKVSILGASDYRYILKMNGKTVKTSTHGFFAVYVTLEEGENTFTFTNGYNKKVLTITRTVPQSSSGGNSGTGNTPSSTLEPEKPVYKAYSGDVFGTITDEYAMPRKEPYSSNKDLIPISKGTVVRLLGEYDNYYKIYDGTYLPKSSVKKSTEKVAVNKVTSVKVVADETTNTIKATLKMNVNVPYKVTVVDDTRIDLCLYETNSTPKATLSDNDTIKLVRANIYKSAKNVIYSFYLQDGATVTGYDAEYSGGTLTFYFKRAPHLEKKGSLSGAVILLDAGHGDDDNGAVGPMGVYGPVEKDINLELTYKIKAYLEKLGAEVVLTRKDDTYITLTNRVKQIRALKPDISVSVHANSMPQTADYANIKGFLVYYTYAFTHDAQKMISDGIDKYTDLYVRTPISENLSLTRLTACPAILLENGFMSNPYDYEYLIDEKYQNVLAEAIGKSIKDYLESNAVYSQKYAEYTVQKGDYLSKIARVCGTTVSEICALNGIKNPDYIYVGQVFKVPAR